MKSEKEIRKKLKKECNDMNVLERAEYNMKGSYLHGFVDALEWVLKD